eukprot:TRINITY_DN2619_c0_g1_i1.p1 TRINITY_DN2619_c0_g1~~TRINITY_DN2619_c0_g1_i1.p1  ORF type:complete len:411 (+),score=63.99 TRINITY_DN2619_c0_g1_i1:24-1256(+)
MTRKFKDLAFMVTKSNAGVWKGKRQRAVEEKGEVAVLGSRSDGSAAYVFKRSIEKLGRNAAVMDAVMIEERMRADGYVFGEMAMTALLAAYAKLRSVRKAESVFDRIRALKRSEQTPLSLNTYNAILNTYCIAGNLTKAKHIFEELKKHHTPSVASYTAIMKLHKRLGRKDNALLTYEAMIADGIQPTGHTLALYLTCCDDIKSARNELSKIDLPYDQHITTALVGLYSRKHDVDGALTALYEGDPSNAAPWSAVFTGFTEYVDFKMFLSCVRRAEGAVKDPDPQYYGILLRAVREHVLATSNNRERHSLSVLTSKINRSLRKLPKNTTQRAFSYVFQVYEALDDVHAARELRDYLISEGTTFMEDDLRMLDVLERRELVRRQEQQQRSRNAVKKPGDRKSYISHVSIES